MKWVSKSAERRQCQGLYHLTIFYTVYTVHIYCVFWVHGWLLKRKDNTQASSLSPKKTKSQVLVDKYKYKSSTGREQSAISLWRTRAEANLEMGRASLEKTGEQSEEQETYFIISAISIIINLLCHFFYPFEIAKVQKLNKRNGSINDQW